MGRVRRISYKIVHGAADASWQAALSDADRFRLEQNRDFKFLFFACSLQSNYSLAHHPSCDGRLSFDNATVLVLCARDGGGAVK
jgi:hypothetical protein